MRVALVLVNLAVGALASAISQSDDGSESHRVNQCGLRGWDRHNPYASKADSSGQQTTFETCRHFCTGFQSFAIDEKSCVCYTAPTINNVRESDDSPFLFYDIGCSIPVKEMVASTASTTSTTTKTLVTSGAATVTAKAYILVAILATLLTTSAFPSSYSTSTVVERAALPASPPPAAPVIPQCFKLQVVGGDRLQNGRWIYDSASHLYLYPQRLETRAEVFKLGDDNMLYSSDNKVTKFSPIGRLPYGPLWLKQGNTQSPVCIIVETGNYDGTEWELVCELNGSTTFYANGLYLYWGEKVPRGYDPIRLNVIPAQC